MALLAAGVALSFAGPIRSMRAGDAVERVRAFDAANRLAARRGGRDVEMVFDLSAGMLSRQEDGGRGGGTGRDAPYRVSLPGTYRIDRLRAVAAGGRVSGVGRGDGDDVGPIDAASGRVVLRCSADGLTRSYAVRVVGPRLDTWLLFAGLTGQATEVRDEAEVDAIFDAARARPR